MWKLAASLGPHLVNHTGVFVVKESARHGLQHIILFFVDAQVLVDKLLRLLSQVFGNPFNVGRGKKRPGRLAAIGAVQAVCFFKLGLMQFLHHIIDVFGRLLFELIEVLFVLDMLIFGQLGQLI